MSSLVVLPILVPALTAALCLAVWRSTPAKRLLGVTGSALHLAAAVALLARVISEGPQAMQTGSWPVPFGITIVADHLSALMVLLGALMGLATAIYSLADIDESGQRFDFFPLLHVLLTGVSGAFLTGDLFNLYVWFEVMLMSSFVLIVLGGGREQMEGGLKYVTLNLVSSAVFLAGVGMLYATAHTLNMADLAKRLPQIAAVEPGFVQAIGALFLIGYGVKAAVVPLHFWLPASYHTPPAAVSAIFAGLLTKVGVYAMIRVFVVILPPSGAIFELLLWIATITMVIGVLGAFSQFEIRRILSFHIVSQIGYMVLGLALVASPDPDVRRLGLAAAVFYIGHHIVVKTNLFFLGGAVRHLRGTYDLKPLGGLMTATPGLAVLFLVPALSLAGIPPLSGFWAKLAVLRAGLQGGEYVAVAAAIFAGLLTLLSMMKIWNEAFWKTPPDGVGSGPAASRGQLLLLVAPIAMLALVTLLIGLFPQPLFEFAGQAADQLLDPSAYAEAVGLEAVR